MSPAVVRIRQGIARAIDLNGNLKGAAATCGRSIAQVGNWNNVNTKDIPKLEHMLALDEVAASTGNIPPIAEAMAREQGYMLFRLPDNAATNTELTESLVCLMVGTGDVAACLRDGLADGNLDPREKAVLLAKIDQALAELVSMRALAKGE